ncbi:hypothetical protein [Solilutibacter silvestris]|uniref:DUF7940 domain-containing protein n=1 Tax=Solilutibacter silvestris TaxID=1645665 RepID=UPI003D337B6E
MNLVPDIHNFWKWWSVQLGLISFVLTGLAATYSNLPVDWTAGIPAWVKTALAAAAMLSSASALVMRGIQQPKLTATPDDPQ